LRGLPASRPVQPDSVEGDIHLCGYPPPPPVGPYGRKMHGARCTAGTEFYLATGDIHAAQQRLGHADVVAIVSIESRD